MITPSQSKLLDLIEEHGPCTVADLLPHYEYGRSVLFRAISALVDSGYIHRQGEEKRRCSRAASYAIGAGDGNSADGLPKVVRSDGPITHPHLEALRKMAKNPFAVVMVQL